MSYKQAREEDPDDIAVAAEIRSYYNEMERRAMKKAQMSQTPKANSSGLLPNSP